jgi:hypothetical protein
MLRSLFFCLLFLVLLLQAAVLVAAGDAGGASTESAVEPRSVYRISTMGGLEMEVWIGGRRVGFTPLTVELPAGRFPISASAESIIPVFGEIVSGGDGKSYEYVIPPAPLTVENYERVGREVAQFIASNARNPHLVIISLHLITSAEDGLGLLDRADRLMPGDPVVEALRARVLLRAGQLDGALRASERALEALPKAALVWRIRGEVLEQVGELQAAMDAANEAMVLDPMGWRTLRLRSRLHEKLGNERGARADTERAEEIYEGLHRMIQSAQEAQRRSGGRTGRTP